MSAVQNLIETVFKDWAQENMPGMNLDDAWEIFTAHLLLRHTDVTLDAIGDGVVDGSNDGGIDAVYTFVEGALLTEDHKLIEDVQAARKSPEGLEINLYVMQAKNNNSFPQSAITSIHSVLARALDASYDLDKLKNEINDPLFEQVNIFRSAHRNLLTRRPRVTVRVAIISRGDTANVALNVSSRAEYLKEALEKVLPSANIDVSFVGAEELWKLYDKRQAQTLSLDCEEVMTSGQSYVALATLGNFVQMISDEDHGLRRHLFDANVRDFQGDVAVNREMMSTLDDAKAPEFWWLNNGVTIICDEAHSVGKKFALTNIQIVNGLQTSHNLSRWFADKKAEDPEGWDKLLGDSRRLLVRIIVADDPVVRDKVIRATNRQTPVAEASLRATDEVQRKIESFFAVNGLYYDRRKGLYKNLGKDAGSIISISYLGQAVFSLAYGKPEVARGKPNSLLAEDFRYKQAFDPKADLSVFYWCARTMRSVDGLLQSDYSTMKYWERRHLSHFIGYAAVVAKLKKSPSHWTDVLDLCKRKINMTDEDLKEAYEMVVTSLEEFTTVQNMNMLDATKRQLFTNHIASKILGAASS